MPDFGFMSPILAGLVAISVALAAWQVIWKRGIVPTWNFCARFFRAVIRIADATPVLIGIAEEFEPNGGNSLRDAVDRKADKADMQRIEAGVLEAIRIGNVNTEHLLESGDRLHEHLQQVSWASERAGVLADLELVKRTQDGLIGGVAAALRGAADPLQARDLVLAALERPPEAGTDDRDR